MKKNYLNNILYFGFKFGKVFAVIALVVLFLVMIGSGLYLLKVGHYEIETPVFSTIQAEIEAQEADSSYSPTNSTVSSNVILKETTEKKFSKDIEKIVFECKLKPFAYDMILTNIMKYDEKYQKQYVEGLEPFISEGLEYVKSKYKADLNNVSRAKMILEGILTDYNRLFNSEISKIDSEKEEQAQSKLIAINVLGISLLLFIICLFLPLFIKIEENTRELLKLSQNKEEKNEEK